ncbi:acyltransferase family protein [Nostoc sp. C117]|uniref:acyltransferase family protein n=1 Tax=Nostoc sp. C117 TaxID=3349875 RepID=UPI00370D0B5B
MKSPAKKIGDIQRLRGFAVLLTVFAHMPLTTGIFAWFKLPSPFWVGVPLFFVISGYVITISTEKYIFNPLSFYIRRLCRILPVLLISIGITLIMAYFTKDVQFYGTYPNILVTVTYMILFISNFSRMFDRSVKMVLSLLGLWSISTEEQFYLFFPLTYLLPSKKIRILLVVGIWFLWGVILRLLTFCYLNTNQNKIVSILKILMQNNGFRYDLILLGMLISYLSLRIPPRRSLFYLCLTFTLLYPEFSHYESYNTILYFIFAASLVSIVVIAKEDKDIIFTEIPLIRTFLDYLGKRSYTIYVMHFQVLALIGYLLQRVEFNFKHPYLYSWALMLGSIPFLLLIELIHRYIEMPVIAWGKAYTSQNSI